jgi:hypothetical protein
MFPAYSPNSTTTVYSVVPGFRPALIQQYSLNVQVEPHEGWLLEAGYVGTHGTHLVRQRSLNQALSTSASRPIRGLTTNSVANIPLRVPILGIPPDSLVEMESEGSSWYNGLEASMSKGLRHGVQFLASYTFSKTLDTDGASINETSSGNALTLGDQNSPRQRWGRPVSTVLIVSFLAKHGVYPARQLGSGERFSEGGTCCCSYHSIWQCSDHLGHQCRQRFRNKH